MSKVNERQYVVSFNPVVEGDINRICAGRDVDEEDIYWIKRAKAVILPNGCSEKLYFTARKYCPNVFPNYLHRFLFPGKVGQIRMFRHYNIRHPKSMLFSSVRSVHERFWRSLKYPVVIKTSQGGEGEGVFLVFSFEELESVILEISSMERSGFEGFLIQEYIPNDGRDLRVVVIGKDLYPYWKVAQNNSFLHNLSKGASVDSTSDVERIEAGLTFVLELIKATGINLAGIDLLFHKEDKKGKYPYILEINYFFGRKGIGGNRRYYELLNKAVREWLKSI